MVLCLFKTSGEYVGYVNFSDNEQFLEGKLQTHTGIRVLSESDAGLRVLPRVTIDIDGRQTLSVEYVQSGQAGFQTAFVRYMQLNGFVCVIFTEPERVSIWRNFLRSPFPKKLQARYAMVLALWPKHDLAFWRQTIPSMV